MTDPHQLMRGGAWTIVSILKVAALMASRPDGGLLAAPVRVSHGWTVSLCRLMKGNP